MITEADIEKLIYRCFENYWNTRDSKINNLRRVPKIAANDVWQVVKQDLPNKHTDHSEDMLDMV